MPSAQVICAGLELAINRVLALDELSQPRLASLAGKSCEVLPIELGFTIKFTFTDTEVLVSAPIQDEHQAQALNNDECRIKLSVFAIGELQDMSNLTRLIKQDKLDFEGNLTIAQKFAELFKALDIDLEELLSKYIGDVAAHTLFENAKQFHQSMLSNLKLTMHTVSDAMLDEKPVAVRAIMIENFNQGVTDLRLASDRLEARLANLEQHTQVEKRTNGAQD